MTRRMTLLVLALVGLMVLVVTVAPPKTAVAERFSGHAGAAPGARTTPDRTLRRLGEAVGGRRRQAADDRGRAGRPRGDHRRGRRPRERELGDLRTDGLRGGPAGAVRRCWPKRQVPTRWSSSTRTADRHLGDSLASSSRSSDRMVGARSERVEQIVRAQSQRRGLRFSPRGQFTVATTSRNVFCTRPAVPKAWSPANAFGL